MLQRLKVTTKIRVSTMTAIFSSIFEDYTVALVLYNYFLWRKEAHVKIKTRVFVRRQKVLQIAHVAQTTLFSFKV